MSIVVPVNFIHSSSYLCERYYVLPDPVVCFEFSHRRHRNTCDATGGSAVRSAAKRAAEVAPFQSPRQGTVGSRKFNSQISNWGSRIPGSLLILTWQSPLRVQTSQGLCPFFQIELLKTGRRSWFDRLDFRHGSVCCFRLWFDPRGHKTHAGPSFVRRIRFGLDLFDDVPVSIWPPREEKIYACTL